MISGVEDARTWVGQNARHLRAATIFCAACLALLMLIVVSPSLPVSPFLVAVGLCLAVMAAYFGLQNPLVALIYLLLALFFRLAIPKVLPVDAFLPAYAGLVVSMAIWFIAKPGRRVEVGIIEVVMVLYIGWNIASAVMPHEYPPISFPITGERVVLYRLLLIGTLMPFTLYVFGRVLIAREIAVRTVLWTIVGLGTYSAYMSIGQFHAPALVWPKLVAETNWIGRANGIVNQPVVNGLILVLSYVIAVVLASQPGSKWWRRIAGLLAVAMAYSVYLTHTRAIYIALLLIIVLGMVLAKGFRTGFVVSFAIVVIAVLTNFSTLTSSDRAAGGVGSTSEVYDRLNTAATSVWGFENAPWFGWGLGRFIVINTYHHQQWSPDIEWRHALGIASHFNELGILTELGLVGLTMWLAILVMLAYRLITALRELPEAGLLGRPLAFIGISAYIALIACGVSVDLRLFDLPSAVVMLIAGMVVGQQDRVRKLNAASQSARKSALSAWKTKRAGLPADSKYGRAIVQQPES
ncbi:O-antigen ligase family protein [Antrihabitans stalactiti]|uniref:O-antigen ligase family protein n=1 Tax=Antrihabitans stalactiti TaxID=2584121 RepID=A0A848KEL0_9NOCA|nr:O-antigen ligase family protein [Antrihabitans stalactiti]NMN96661.1 O-antigen ligase family protein [Antrihabitans stalactiti]